MFTRAVRKSLQCAIRTTADRARIRSYWAPSKSRIALFGSTIALFVAMTSSAALCESPCPKFVQPENSVDPFPVHLTVENVPYKLLGAGVRTISFLKVRVYAVGIYIAQEDVPRVRKTLGGLTDVESMLLDPQTGPTLVLKLLRDGIRMDLRIVPVRNTDFGHLRDGFVRAILANPASKNPDLVDGPHFGDGLAQLKTSFSRKRSVPKNQILHLIRDQGGVLNILFFNAARESDAQVERLGQVQVPAVSDILFLQYLTGKSPSSHLARQSSIKTLASMCNEKSA